MIECAHCGREFESADGGYTRHAQACAKRPTRKTLLRWVAEKRTLEWMAGRTGVNRLLVVRWLKEEGIERESQGRSKRQLTLLRELAPLDSGMCERCVGEGMCGLRVRLGLWVLCEAPELVEAAVGIGTVWVWALMWERLQGGMSVNGRGMDWTETGWPVPDAVSSEALLLAGTGCRR